MGEFIHDYILYGLGLIVSVGVWVEGKVRANQARIALNEERISNIKDDTAEIKADVKELVRHVLELKNGETRS